MSFLGSSSQQMNSGFNSGYSGQYGGSFGGTMMSNLNRGGSGGIMNQYDSSNPNQMQQNVDAMNQAYQFDLRRDMQSTIGGLNASLGLVYGLTQLGNLSLQGLKIAFKCLKFLLSKIFNTNNIVAPVKLMMRLLFGTDFTKHSRQAQSLELLEKIWQNSEDRSGKFLPNKVFGMSANLLKSIILALLGMTIQFTLFLLKRGKTQRLLQLQEQEEEQKRLLMEELWRKQQSEMEPELVILKELEDDADNTQAIKGYDGQLNAMTFNHVKGSKAFESKKLIDVIEEDMSWLDDNNLSTINPSDVNKSLFDTKNLLNRTSEDGWNRRKMFGGPNQQPFTTQ